MKTIKECTIFKSTPLISDLERAEAHKEIVRMSNANKEVDNRNKDKMYHRMLIVSEFMDTNFSEGWSSADINFNLEPLPYSEEQITELVIQTF